MSFAECFISWRSRPTCGAFRMGLVLRCGRNIIGCASLAFLAVLSKEMAVTLPLIFLILDAYPLRRLSQSDRHPWIEKIPFLVISVADSVLALYTGKQELISASMTHVGLFTRVAISLYSLAYYLWKTALPIHLSPFHALTPHRTDPGALPLQLSVAVVILISVAAWILRWRFPSLLAVWLAYAMTLIPVLGIFQNGWQITADRYTYLACLGWALLAGIGLLALWTAWETAGKWTVSFVAAIAAGALGYLTWQQTQVWRNSETLWTYSLAVDPSSVALNNLGELRSESSDVSGALEYYRQAVQMDSGNPQAYNNLGMALLELGEWDVAQREFHEALKLWPEFPNSHFGLGYSLMKQGKLDDAIVQFQTAVNMNPRYAAARRNLDEALRLKNAPR